MSSRTPFRYRLASTIGLVSAIAVAPALQAQTSAAAGSIEQRLERIERLLQSSGLMRMLEDVETLKQEVRDLRGAIELQAHSVRQVQEHQRELYLDVDRRLQHVETGGVSSPSLAATPPAAPAVASPPAGARPLSPPPSSANVAPPAAPPSSTSVAPPPAAPPPVAVASPPAASVSAPPSTAPTTVAAAPPATTQPAAPSSPSDAAREQRAYQDAFSLLKAGRYEQASKAFQTFLREYPNGQFTDNAQYWLGETYYVTRQFDLAMEEFQTLTREHPKSQKQTHALLKIGYIYDELGQTADARRVLEDLVSRYPQTTAAALARKRLQRLRSE